MKRVLFLMIILLAQISVFAQVKKVAILETVDKENQISYANKLILRASLSKAVTKTAGYEAYDRTDIDAIMSEHSFQRTGMVEEDQIKKLGEMTGADYILVTEVVVVDANNIFVTAKLLDVVTARTILTDNVMMGNTSDKIKSGCNILAKKLLENNDLTKVEDKKEKKTKKEPQTIEGPLLERHSKSDQRLFGLSEYSYGETQMDKKALEAFLRNSNPDLYKRYLRGKSCIKAGWAIFGIGLATTAAGGACMILSDMYNDKAWELKQEYNIYLGMPDDERIQYLRDGYQFYESSRWLWEDVGIGLMSGGAGLTVISIPILSAGYGIKNNIHKKYNEQAQPQLTLKLQSSQNGLGIALNF